jgi:hypothetical protein
MIRNVGGDMKKSESSLTASRKTKWYHVTSALENSLEVPQKLNIKLPGDLAIPVYMPSENTDIRPHKNLYMTISTNIIHNS